MQKELFYFLCSVQAPLGTGEVFRPFAVALNLGGGRGGARLGGLQTAGPLHRWHLNSSTKGPQKKKNTSSACLSVQPERCNTFDVIVNTRAALRVELQVRAGNESINFSFQHLGV